jgi:hypothetical protein
VVSHKLLRRKAIRATQDAQAAGPEPGSGGIASGGRTKGEHRCLLCDHVLEVFDGSTEGGIRLTVQPEKTVK